MSESTWWREELWWEKGLFQLGGTTISARQLFTLAGVAAVALVVSLPAGFAIEGIPFAGRFVIFGLLVAVGYFGLVTRRVKMVPVEMQLYYWLAKGRGRSPETTSAASTSRAGELTASHQITVDDFRSPVPFTFTDRVRVGAPTRVQVVVDGTVRDEAAVTRENGEYRLMYVPQVGDIGVKDGMIKLQGSEQPLSRFRITVNAKGVNLLEAKEHVG
ncbi:MAG: hypothetical protein JRN06_00165 [Nitrososphaerota archaeon]|nr:hypothetical protein [Nitrososphaerota archaeon]MDG7023734.1 hypothetical protein [Nitrososphaerota archaeon]